MRNAEFEPERARRVLWTGVLVFRAASFVWMVLANILATAPIRHPVVGWAAVGLTGAWTAYLILVYFGLDPRVPEAFRRTSLERSGRDRPDVVLWFDLALAAGLVVLSGYEVDRSSIRIFFATTYPASAALAWGAARGRTAGLVAGLLLGVGLALERQVSGLSLLHLGRDDTVSLLNGAVYYLLAGGAAGVVRRTIDQSEEQMRVIAEERERARAERERAREQASEERASAMAERARAEEKASWVDWVRERTKVDLHKPVMNKLELAARALRRLAQLDVVPEAELILEAQRLEEIADRIRGFRDEIISPTPPKEGQASLEAAILEAASSVDGASPEVDSAAVTGRWLPATTCEAVARAVTEALLNTVKYAGPCHCWIRAEIDAGTAVISVRDDGRGFVFDRAEIIKRTDHMGLREEIIGCIESIGGSVVIAATPGAGSEITLRVPLPPSVENPPR